ncbi:unnamed protein product [Dibothriocephalus latus]|uniref:Uncharacterized protein n=1 Tax=Dibothriocephalus latus TaxID=60516 RepID=A0A3P7P9U9_DIBLA|nr:unnamed protein product [Dibothriocephalus latus]
MLARFVHVLMQFLARLNDLFTREWKDIARSDCLPHL